jgi:hypothetical protein
MRQPNYATALRCIAQHLELRGLKTFDIRSEGTGYIALCGYQDPPSATPVTVQFSPADIEELDRSGEENRGKSLPAKEFLNQIQILRTIGGYLDKNEARLIRISNNDSPGTDSLFRVEYQSRTGEHVIDDRAGAAIYDMCVVMYKQRRNLTGTGSRTSRWRR